VDTLQLRRIKRDGTDGARGRSLAVVALMASVGFVVPCLPAYAERLVIEGVDEAVELNVRAFVPLADEPCDAPAWRIQRRFDRIDAPLRKALEAYGYYEPSYESDLSLAGDCWTATLRIDPGNRVMLRRVRITFEGEAQTDPAFAQFRRRNAPTPGRDLVHSMYNDFKRGLRILAAERGYLDAEFIEARLDIWLESDAADMTIVFDSGRRYAFGRTDIEQDAVNPELVARFMNYSTGEPFDRTRLTLLQQRFLKSGYFDRINILPQFEASEDLQIPIRITMTPAERIGYFAGVGVSTDRGPRVRGGYNNRRVNGEGHKISVDGQISAEFTDFGTTYRMPLEDPLREWQTYAFRVTDDETDTSQETAYQLLARRTRALDSGWLVTYGAEFRYSDFRVADVDDQSRLLIPAIGVSRREEDDETNPRNGYAMDFRLSGTSQAIGSSTGFVQLTGSWRWLHALSDSTLVRVRTQFGTTWKREFDALPPDIRFFTGGDTSVRGYNFETLGPENDDGEVIGGSHLAVASLELERRVRGNWGVAAFVDSGNAFDGTDFSPRTGVGLGLVWRSPVGPLRVYLAHPLDDPDTTVRLHVTFGAGL
jgi:translocation and assembly module TamA